MKITNNLNLPASLVDVVSREYEYKDKRYSVTSLLKGVRETILQRRHHNEIEQDVSEMIWLILGTAAHRVMEDYNEGQEEFKEEKLSVPIGEYTLSGIFDLYSADKKQVVDYKTCSVWKIIHGDYDEWKMQLLIYAYMLRELGFPCECGQMVAIMKDHSKTKARVTADYPDYPVKVIDFEFSIKDFAFIEHWLKLKFENISLCEDLPDDKLPICTPEERYNQGDKYACMKKGRKRALRVFDTLEEAETYECDYVDVRKGEDTKCKYYCSAREFCNYYKEEVEE
jgi:hypothetical protein